MTHSDQVQPRSHALLVADDDRQCRAVTAMWIDRELRGGAKVYYKGWLGDGLRPDQHWIAGAAPQAFATGQLEFLDFLTVIERCGGTSEGLARLQTDEIVRAMDQGFPRVAMSQESPQRPMADDQQVADFVTQEHGYDRMIERWPLDVLCQLTVSKENDTAIRETVALHHREILDRSWSASSAEDRWWLRGELDAHVAGRFGAAVSGVMRRARHARGEYDLHIDLSEVAFMDVACVLVLLASARSAPAQRRLVLHRPSTVVGRLLEAIGRPPTVLLGDEVPAV